MQLTTEQLIEARDWLSDCDWRDMEPDEFSELSDRAIERGIARHYDGGIQAFIAACESATTS